jgi:hypothetical protein
MPAEVTREEFEARVGVLEQEVEGEKLVTRHILEQTRRNSDDLAAIKTRLDRVEGRFDRVEGMREGSMVWIKRSIGSIERWMLSSRIFPRWLPTWCVRSLVSGTASVDPLASQ